MKTFSDEALDALRRLPWRGNVRELMNAVERVLIMAPGDTVGRRRSARRDGTGA